MVYAALAMCKPLTTRKRARHETMSLMRFVLSGEPLVVVDLPPGSIARTWRYLPVFGQPRGTGRRFVIVRFYDFLFVWVQCMRHGGEEACSTRLTTRSRTETTSMTYIIVFVLD